MKKIFRFSFSFFLALTMSLTNIVPIFAQEENNEEIVEEIVEENNDSEEKYVEPQIEDSDTNNSELKGDSTCIEYFLLEDSNVSSTQNFVLSLLKDEGYTNFSIDVQDAYGNIYNVESNERVNNLIKFTYSFSNGSYVVTNIHYQLNEENYVISLNEIGIDAKFGVNQEVYSSDELVNLEEISETTTTQEGVVTIDAVNINQTENMIEEELVSPQSYAISSYALEEQSDNIVICLDPGHGGTEPGTYTYYSSQDGLYEKYYNLKIAQYCKQELEKYANVTVYMTRYDDTNLGLQERAQVAANYGASYLISIHLNGLNGSNRGAVVFYPNTNYRPDLSEDGKVVAQSILNELTSLGIQSMGIRTNTIDGHDEKYDYPDGSEGDYYGVIRHAKNLGITGLIIEHCFADNKQDFDEFLSSEAKLQNLGIADATGIAKALGLSIDTSAMDDLAYQNKDVLADGIYEIQSALNSSYVFDVTSGSLNDAANVQLYKSNCTEAQAWKVSHDSKGYVTFTNVKSGKVLDVNAGKATNSQNVQQYTSNNTMAQKWIVIQDGSRYEIVSALNKSYCLDLKDAKVANSSNIQIYQRKNSTSQRWTFAKFVSTQQKLDDLAAANKDVLTDGTYEIQSALNSSYVLDVTSGSLNNGANVQLYQSNCTEAQGWKVSHDSKGYVTFTNVKSGKVLDVNGGKAAKSANIQQYTSQNIADQKWIVIKDENSYQIVSALDSGYCLDLASAKVANSSNIQLYESNGTKAQRWTFEKFASKQEKLDDLASANKDVLADGTYEIQSALNSSYVLDVTSGSLNNGANIQLYQSNCTEAQGWKVSHDSKGYVTFTNVKSGKVLDVSGGVAGNSKNIQQYTSQNTVDQKWIVIKDGNSYQIVSALDSNYCIDLYSAKVVNSSNIQLYQSNGTKAQRWIFATFKSQREKLDDLALSNSSFMEDGTYYIKNKNINYALDVTSASINDGANVQLYSFNSTKAQRWIVSHDAKGYVLLQNEGSGKYLTVASNTAKNSVNVYQYSNLNSYSQRWIVMFDGTGSIKIVSALDSNFVIDITSGKVQNSSNIQLYSSNNTAAQQWVFALAEQISEPDQPESTLHPIMGSSEVTVNQMVSYFKSKNPNYDIFSKYGTTYDGILAKGGASTIEIFCQMYYEEALIEGIKPEIAFVQAMLETGFLQYGGDVKPDQYNFAGMGATGNGVAGNSFVNVRTGIRAHIQHLKCYASTEPLNTDRVDPRWSESLRGKAIYVEYLSIPNNPYGTGWAGDANYAEKIINMVNEMKTK
ncbi:RICIN domain-containing protein [Floccifex sp.]|uniref:RICIN domain-containing protein n=1 Tax=Floccifex sp. TaxID=2815810 RepID=UPI003F05F136